MARKRRSINQINEEVSLKIFSDSIPDTWVIHEYGPDYGIDCVVELFDYVDEKKNIAETLGEIFYVQLKSSVNINYSNKKVYPRGNVEKGTLAEDKSEFYEINVATFQLETSELLTVQAMGPAIPVLLVLVDINTKRSFYVCLNDYIDKIIIPSDQLFSEKKSKVIHIPLKNEISLKKESLMGLRAYGKRSKMYGAFTKFSYQKKEIERILGLAGFNQSMSFEQARNMLKIFTLTALNQDIWCSHEFWKPILASHEELKEINSAIDRGIHTEKEQAFIHHCHQVWYRLDNLSNMYEELVREWFMPSFLAQLTSYPDYEEAQKA
jgi:uncharacterized protein DUF4365